MWTDYRLGSCGIKLENSIHHTTSVGKQFNYYCLLQQFAMSVCDGKGSVWYYACLLIVARKQSVVLNHVFVSEKTVL